VSPSLLFARLSTKNKTGLRVLTHAGLRWPVRQGVCNAPRRLGGADAAAMCVCQLMGRKVTDMLASGKYDKSEMLPTLRTYEANLHERVTQV